MDLALAAGHTNISILDDLTTAAPFTIPGRGTDVIIRIREGVIWTISASSLTPTGGKLSIHVGTLNITSAFTTATSLSELELIDSEFSEKSSIR